MSNQHSDALVFFGAMGEDKAEMVGRVAPEIVRSGRTVHKERALMIADRATTEPDYTSATKE